MSPFTEEAMTRPLFEEPGEHIERPDEWSGPKGFLLGADSGMGGSPSMLDIAQDYMEAAYVLTEAIMKNDWEDYRLGYPLFYLYRHAIELFIKGVMPTFKRGHDLSFLAKDFSRYMKDSHGIEVPEWIIKRLDEIASVDPESTAFRYGGTKSHGTNKDEPIPGEMYVSLPHLQDAMVALNWALASVVGDISTERMEALANHHAQRRYLQRVDD